MMALSPEAALAEVYLLSANGDQVAAIASIAQKLSHYEPGPSGFVSASLLIELLLRYSNDNVQDCAELQSSFDLLLAFVEACLGHTNSKDVPQLHSFVEFCQRLPELARSITDNCLASIRYSASRPQDSYLVDSAHFMLRKPRVPEELTNLSLEATELSSAIAPSYPYTNVIKCLAFIRIYLWSQACIPSSYVARVKDQLLVLVGSETMAISEAANATLLALISYQSRKTSDEESTDRLSAVASSATTWERLLDLTGTRSHLADIGLSLWSRLLSSKNEPFPTQILLQADEYWSNIIRCLADGFTQQRKHCLFILKSSLARLESDVECFSMTITTRNWAACLDQYYRYNTLYETIVLARYLNQVQDCLSDLDNITKPESLVREPWIIALLVGALENNMQDSVRKVMGDWTMINGPRLLHKSLRSAPEFLERSFLPWASIAYLYTSTVCRVSATHFVCSHGERLLGFLKALLVYDMTHDERAAIIGSILNFLVAKGAQMYAYARAYILEGLVKAVETTGCSLGPEDANLILQLFSIAGFQGMVRDFMILLCGRLIAFVTDEACAQNNLTSLLRASSALRGSPDSVKNYPRASFYLRSVASSMQPGDESLGIGGEEDEAEPSVRNFLTWIHVSHNRCLAGPGLEAACAHMLNALDNNTEELRAEELCHALQAMWDELEVQDYPKRIVMCIPSIFFHGKVVTRCSPSNCLTVLLSKCAHDLQRLAENRVYAYSSLAASLRKAFLYVPEAVHLPFVELFTQFAMNLPTIKVEFELETVISPKLEALVPSRIYSAYYGEAEGYGHACIFDTLNKLPITPKWQELRKHVLDAILCPWLRQKQPIPMTSRWKSSAQLQMVLLLVEALSQTASSSRVEKCLARFHAILAVEPIPRLRYLLEWIIIRLYMCHKEHRHEVQQFLEQYDLSNPKRTVSMMKIALMLACLPDSDEPFALEYMIQLISLAASPKIGIRHEAHWTVPLMYEEAVKREWTSIVDNPAFARLNKHIRGLDTYKNPPLGRTLEMFGAIEDHTLSNLFEGDHIRMEPIERQRVLRGDFLAVWMGDLGVTLEKAGTSGFLPLGAARMRAREPSPGNETPVPATTPIPKESSATIPLQTKASTWGDPATLLSESNDVTRPTRSVIVVSSLINNAYNIGGLSRVSEIFGVESLHVENLSVLKSKDFTSVSVSSHLWLPILELSPDGIPAFLIEKKLKDYTVIGIEQTDSSKVLGEGDWKFPEKVVLVLGSEREGIPALLLGEMDFCVEVRQVGVTRSMNVQTAAAVCLYDYARQHA